MACVVIKLAIPTLQCPEQKKTSDVLESTLWAEKRSIFELLKKE